jgi:hypothetical protein
MRDSECSADFGESAGFVGECPTMSFLSVEERADSEVPSSRAAALTDSGARFFGISALEDAGSVKLCTISLSELSSPSVANISAPRRQDPGWSSSSVNANFESTKLLCLNYIWRHDDFREWGLLCRV